MPQRSLPVAVWLRKRLIDRVELVFEKRIGDLGCRSIWFNNTDVIEGDNFGRGNGVSSPVPVWSTKVSCGSLPVLLVNGVLRGDSDGVLLQSLLPQESV